MDEVDRIADHYFPGMVEDLLNLEKGLNDWEMEFLDSMQNRLDNRDGLTRNMKIKILQIHRAKS